MVDALLFYHYQNKLTGSTFNAFEYYLTILKTNPNFYLYLIDCPPRDLQYYFDVVENRYDLQGVDYQKNVRTVALHKMIYEKFNRVLVLDYGTIFRTRGTFGSKEMTVICEYPKEDPNYMYNKKIYPVTYYGEMPFVTYKDKQYRMKLGFNLFKKIGTPKSAVYINSPYNNDFSFVKTLPIPSGKPIIYKADTHLTNLFEQFDEYYYYHANKWFDPHPRLFLECAFYNKKIQYYNIPGVKDGSFYRYNDLLANGLKDRTLTEEDEIVRRFWGK